MSSEVIIIGAGAAGLAAADELTKQGIRPLVIEARDRVGGRIYTLRDDRRRPVELGAEFVHGRAPEIFDIAREAGLEIAEYTGESWLQQSDGRLLPQKAENIPGGESIWQELEELAADLEEDVSVREYLDRLAGREDLTDEIRYFESYVAGFHAAETEKISLMSLLKTETAEEEIEGERAFHLSAGYGSLVDYLFEKTRRQGAEFRLGTVVTTVKWEKFRVQITVAPPEGAERQLSARVALLTLPVGVLKADPGEAGAVRFEPELASKREALSRIEMGAARRVTIAFKRKWWLDVLSRIDAEKSRLGFLFGQGAPMRVWWTREPSDAPVLTGWVGGARAFELSNYDAEYLINRAIDSLCRLFGVGRSFIEDEIAGAYTFDWQADPFSRGSYSYLCVGGLKAPEQLACPLENTLFFAGEATSYEGYWGTVHGALASGKRAAREVISALG